MEAMDSLSFETLIRHGGENQTCSASWQVLMPPPREGFEGNRWFPC